MIAAVILVVSLFFIRSGVAAGVYFNETDEREFLRVGVVSGPPPFVIYEEGGRPVGGVVVEQVDALCRRAGLEWRLVKVRSRKEALEKVLSGDLDVATNVIGGREVGDHLLRFVPTYPVSVRAAAVVPRRCGDVVFDVFDTATRWAAVLSTAAATVAVLILYKMETKVDYSRERNLLCNLLFLPLGALCWEYYRRWSWDMRRARASGVARVVFIQAAFLLSLSYKMGVRTTFKRTWEWDAPSELLSPRSKDVLISDSVTSWLTEGEERPVNTLNDVGLLQKALSDDDDAVLVAPLETQEFLRNQFYFKLGRQERGSSAFRIAADHRRWASGQSWIVVRDGAKLNPAMMGRWLRAMDDLGVTDGLFSRRGVGRGRRWDHDEQFHRKGLHSLPLGLFRSAFFLLLGGLVLSAVAFAVEAGAARGFVPGVRSPEYVKRQASIEEEEAAGSPHEMQEFPTVEAAGAMAVNGNRGEGTVHDDDGVDEVNEERRHKSTQEESVIEENSGDSGESEKDGDPIKNGAEGGESCEIGKEDEEKTVELERTDDRDSDHSAETALK